MNSPDRLDFSTGRNTPSRPSAMAVCHRSNTSESEISAQETLGQESPSLTQSAGNRSEKLAPAVQALHILEDSFASRLSFNSDANCPFLDGQPLNIDELFTGLCKDHHLVVPMGYLRSIVTTTARANTYSPLRDMVEACRLSDDDDSNHIQTCVREVLHLTEELDEVLLRKYLIGAIARVLTPGNKMDNVLVLQGPQGIGKSTFVETLAGPGNYDCLTGQVGDKDSLMKLLKPWLIELPECETIINASGNSKLKAFVSQAEDTYRAPYAAGMTTHKRHCAFIGTTNETQFLTDRTGNRRYWVLRLTQPIDLQRLHGIRSRILGQALRLFEAGQQWHLTDDEEALLRERLAYHEIDPDEAEPWVEAVTEWAQSQTEPFALTSYLTHLGVDTWRQSPAHTRRIAPILRSLGFEKQSIRLPGCGPRKLWTRPDLASAIRGGAQSS